MKSDKTKRSRKSSIVMQSDYDRQPVSGGTGTGAAPEPADVATTQDVAKASSENAARNTPHDDSPDPVSPHPLDH